MDAQVNGSYLIVEMHRIAEAFCVELTPSVPPTRIATIATAMLAVLLLMVLVRRLAKRRRSAKAALKVSETDAKQTKEPVAQTM